jgi:Ran GTPase-activating protein (RanGAP) involved in mRNA processing and transport
VGYFINFNGRVMMEDYLAKSLDEWKEDISEVLNQINTDYEDVKKELKVYSYKYGITKQVIQSTVNEEIIENIREMYHKPFEEKYNELKEYIRDLDEKRKVFQMFVNKIDEVKRKESPKTDLAAAYK